MDEMHVTTIEEFQLGSWLYCETCGASIFIEKGRRYSQRQEEWARLHQRPLPYPTPAERPAIREDL